MAILPSSAKVVAPCRCAIRRTGPLDDVQAKLRSIIKRLLAEHGYPSEEQPDAI
ncbi:type I restriction enzyme endonuclease domain-containing protein [Actinomadura violacea]|uniref:DUF3387 domain-containing protein n=1 Tax=Actinomadura violacea TaxID=2819934 RepID=A0ABS3S923_9ACTN|nr:type I restriction enzyme endonuclease domain-containing protein [Actinomadura violacea]MBO2465228.1 DUF3387 domain-containing protein [Actinomadura violacea]